MQESEGKLNEELSSNAYQAAQAKLRGCGQLRGPINDVKCMRQLLCQRFAFPSDGIIMLTGVCV